MLACPMKHSPEWKALVEAYGEPKAYTLFVKNNFDIPTLEATERIIAISVGEPDSPTDITMQQRIQFAEFLKKIIPVPYRFRSQSEIRQLILDEEKYDIKNDNVSYYDWKKNLITYDNTVSEQIILHEYAHPLLLALAKHAPQVFNSLLADAKALPTYSKVLATMRKRKDQHELFKFLRERIVGFTEQGQHEILALTIEAYGKERDLKALYNPAQQKFIDRVWREFIKMLQSVFKAKIFGYLKAKDIPAHTVQELLDIMLNPKNRIDLQRGKEAWGMSAKQANFSIDEQTEVEFFDSETGFTIEQTKESKLLNTFLEQFLAKHGIETHRIDDLWKRFGQNVTAVADMLNKVILISKGKENVESMPEEFSHFLLGMLNPENPLRVRLQSLAMLHPLFEQVRKEYAEFSEQEQIFETAGKLLGKALREVTEVDPLWTKIKAVAIRIWNKIKSIFANMDETEITRKIEEIFKQTATDILTGQFVEDLSVSNLTIYNKLFQKAPKDATAKVQSLLDDVRIVIAGRMEQARRTKKFAVTEEYEKLLDTLKNVDKLDGITAFVSRAYEDTIRAANRLHQAASGTIPVTDKIKEMNRVHSFLDTYKEIFPSIATVIQKESDMYKQIQWIIATATELHETYIENVIPEIAEILWTHVPIEEFNADKRTKEKMTLEKFTEMFQIAEKDENYKQLMFDETIGTHDAVFATYAKALKQMMYDAKDETEREVIDLQEWTQELISAEGKFRDQSPASIFGQMIDKVTRTTWRDEERIVQTEAWLMTPTDWTAWYAAEAELWEAADKEEDPKRRRVLIRQWYEAHTELRDDWKDVIKQMKEEFGGSDTVGFKAWLHSNTKAHTGSVYDASSRLQIEIDGFWYIARHDLVQPDKKKYKNERYESLSEAQKKYLERITPFYLGMQSMYPSTKRRGLQIPAVHKTAYEKVLEKGPVSAIREWWINTFSQTKRDELVYGEMDDEHKKAIPIYYNFDIDIKDVSYDLFGSLAKYAEAAIMYKHKAEVAHIVDAMTAIMKEREIVARTEDGKPILSRIGKTLGIEKRLTGWKQESGLYQHFIEFTESIFYGKTRIRSKVDKPMDAVISYTAALMLGANIYQATADWIRGKIHAWSETFGKEFVTPAKMLEAEVTYLANVHNFLADSGKAVPTTVIGQIVQMIDPIQGHARNRLRSAKTGTALRKDPTATFLQAGSDHNLGITFMIGVLKTFKVYDKEGNPLKNDNGEEMDLWTALHETDAKGRIKLNPKISYFEHQTATHKVRVNGIQDLRNRIHATRRAIEGNRNEFDRPLAMRRAGFRPFMVFRSWIFPGWNRRWGRIWNERTFNFEAARWEEGQYHVFRKFVKGLIQQLFNTRQEIEMNWSTMTPTEKKAVLATTQDLAWVTLFIAIFYSLSGDDDDEWWRKFTRYQSRRLIAEFTVFTYPMDALAIIKSPVASVGVIRASMNLLTQFFNPAEEFERDTAKWPKGYNKLAARIQEMFPIWAKLQAAKDPDEALKAFRLW